MMPLLYPVLLASQLVLAADRPPKLNIEPSCRAAVAVGTIGRTKQACLDDENKARSDLDGRWANFAAADQARCTSMAGRGGRPSYVELLTCLEMAEQTKKKASSDPSAGIQPSR